MLFNLLGIIQMSNLVLSGMFLLLYFSQGKLQVIDVFLELRAFILQLSLLASELGVDFFFILQSLSYLFEFCLQLNLALDKSLTSLLSI